MTDKELSRAKKDLQTEVYERAFYAEGTADFLKKKIRRYNKSLIYLKNITKSVLLAVKFLKNLRNPGVITVVILM